jgi:hypothetical protein
MEDRTVTKKRPLTEDEITQSTGARIAGAQQAGADDSRASASDTRDPVYQVQLEGEWIEVDHASYERVRAIQDSCA